MNPIPCLVSNTTMQLKSVPHRRIAPRLIIHGGAGNITPSTLPPELYQEYRASLLTIVSNTYHYLLQDHNALDTATFAVSQLENDPLFNSGRGSVFTRDGTNELEASIMVSRGKKKRGVGVMGLRHVKNPIKLAREMLIRGEQDLEGGSGEHRGPMADRDSDFSPFALPGGAQSHSQLYGETAEKLAAEWGLEMVNQKYFFVQKRWDEHVAGLEREKKMKQATWDAAEHVSQGTVGAVAMDADGLCCCATSTGGMTNKLPGRVGDTPTLGAGYWAEEWEEKFPAVEGENKSLSSSILILSDALRGLIANCQPSLAAYIPIPTQAEIGLLAKGDKVVRATAISGTGNGDSFLRVNAVRTASAIVRYRGSTPLQNAITEITGPGGELVKSAGDRWQKTGEGEGGMIGIESKTIYDKDGTIKTVSSEVVYDYNCGGMFKAYINRKGKVVCRVWKPGQYEGLEAYEGEGVEHDVQEWTAEKV